MEIGESTVRVGEHPSIGPVRIEIGQTMLHPTVHKATSHSEELLEKLVANTEHIDMLLTIILKHLIRPPWWVRLWRRIHVAFTG